MRTVGAVVVVAIGHVSVGFAVVAVVVGAVVILGLGVGPVGGVGGLVVLRLRLVVMTMAVRRSSIRIVVTVWLVVDRG